MQGSSSTSFIPKHTPNKGERKNSPRQLFIGTLIVRILFFAVMVASIGVFFYERSLKKQLASEVAAFQLASGTFAADEEKVTAVTNMDLRLNQATARFNNSVSIASLFNAIERATIETVQFKSLEIVRESDTEINLSANIDTDTFDSVIFQRSILEGSDVLGSVEVSDVSVDFATLDEEEIKALAVKDMSLSFSAKIGIKPITIPAVVVMDKPATVPNLPPLQTEPDPVAASSSDEASVGIEISNEENI